ncbi:hypothetical protein HMPREF1326_00811 [Akkermansia sp. KLE1605]|nr:hypothetical protein HMPREF1326_00811 [Akkermansia sp. KLE1605]
MDDLATERKEWSLPTETVIRLSYDGFPAPLRKEAAPGIFTRLGTLYCRHCRHARE